MLQSPVRLSSPLMRYVAIGLDMLTIWCMAWLVYHWPIGVATHGPMPARYSLMALASSLMMILCGGSLYRSWRVNGLDAIVLSVLRCWSGVILITVVWLFLTKSATDISRLWFVAWSIGSLLAMCIERALVYALLHWLRRQGYNFKMVLLVGPGPMAQQVQTALASAAWSGMQIQATVAPGDVAAFIQKPDQRQPDEVWLCLPLADQEGIQTALDALRHSTANIRLVPDWFALKLINHGISEVLGISMLDLSASPITGSTRVVKIVQDLVLASAILLLISPLLLLIALAVKLTSPGPVLFMQRRHGWNGEEIWVYKFRSMVVHQEAKSQVTQARQGDSRITPLGAFLRRTSLDELPQFFNVLQGRMSIVGPRPHAVQHNEHYKELVPGYMLRHKVKPGITGWAQINGFRGETDTLEKMQKRVEYDLYYIEHLSLWLDLKIILTTIFKGFVHRNAY